MTADGMTTIVSHLSATGDLSEDSVNARASSQEIWKLPGSGAPSDHWGKGVGVPTEKCMGPS